MCQEAKIEGNFTNHSLRATGATVFFQRRCSREPHTKEDGPQVTGCFTYLRAGDPLPGSCSCSDIVEFNHPSRIMQLIRYCRVQPPFHIILQKSRLMTCLCSLFHLQIRSFLTIFLIMSTLHELSYFAPCGIVLLQYRHL